jgi:hypothetical protein
VMTVAIGQKTVGTNDWKRTGQHSPGPSGISVVRGRVRGLLRARYASASSRTGLPVLPVRFGNDLRAIEVADRDRLNVG